MIISRAAEADWEPGRADMLYRDLIPGRKAGRFIASHIRIAQPGPVPDWVHYHLVRFQMIYCYRGWVRVVYEDQGPPLLLEPGDCVLQPPQIRHRVLESAGPLEVIEVSSPADHETRADGQMQLPTSTLRPDREFSGQRFAFHRAAEATWQPWRRAGFQCRDLGIAGATGNLATVSVARPAGRPEPGPWTHQLELCFGFVLAGSAVLDTAERGRISLGAGDCFEIPPGAGHSLSECSDDFELLDVTL